MATTDTDDGTRSPCRLKLTTYRNSPSGVTCIVAGNIPSVTWPSTVSSATAYFHTEPNGCPCASETKYVLPSGDMATPCGPSMSFGMRPVGSVRSSVSPCGPKRTTEMTSAASDAT